MSTRRRLCALVVVAVITMLAGSGQAWAQAPSMEVGADDVPEATPPSEASADASSEAKRLYAQGKGEYAQGHYVEAIALFERSYALSEAPGLLFNMAQAHRLAGEDHCPQALALYRSYLAALPEAENRREVEERVTDLSECANTQTQPTTPTYPLPTAEPKVAAPSLPLELGPDLATTAAATPSRTGPWVVTSIGAALLVTGGILYGTSLAKHREAERVCPCYPGTYATWEVLTNVSYAALAVGGATLGAGVSWWVLAAPPSGARPTHAVLSVSGAF